MHKHMIIYIQIQSRIVVAAKEAPLLREKEREREKDRERSRERESDVELRRDGETWRYRQIKRRACRDRSIDSYVDNR